MSGITVIVGRRCVELSYNDEKMLIPVECYELDNKNSADGNVYLDVKIKVDGWIVCGGSLSEVAPDSLDAPNRPTSTVPETEPRDVYENDPFTKFLRWIGLAK